MAKDSDRIWKDQAVCFMRGVRLTLDILPEYKDASHQEVDDIVIAVLQQTYSLTKKQKDWLLEVYFDGGEK